MLAALLFPANKNPGVSTRVSVWTEPSNSILSDPGGVVCRYWAVNGFFDPTRDNVYANGSARGHAQAGRTAAINC